MSEQQEIKQEPLSEQESLRPSGPVSSITDATIEGQADIFACDHCDKVFDKETSLKMHKLRAHRVGESRGGGSKKSKATGTVPHRKIPDDMKDDPEIDYWRKRAIEAETRARARRAEVADHRHTDEIRKYDPNYGFPRGSRRQGEIGPLSDVEMSRYIRSQRERDERGDGGSPSSLQDDGTSVLIGALTDKVESLEEKLDTERERRLNDKLDALKEEIQGLRHKDGDAKTAAVHEVGDVIKGYFNMLQAAVWGGPPSNLPKVQRGEDQPALEDMVPKEYLED